MENALYNEIMKEICFLAPAGVFFWMLLHIRKKKRETGRRHKYIEGRATSIILDTDTHVSLVLLVVLEVSTSCPSLSFAQYRAPHGHLGLRHKTVKDFISLIECLFCIDPLKDGGTTN